MIDRFIKMVFKEPDEQFKRKKNQHAIPSPIKKKKKKYTGLTFLITALIKCSRLYTVIFRN